MHNLSAAKSIQLLPEGTRILFCVLMRGERFVKVSDLTVPGVPMTLEVCNAFGRPRGGHLRFTIAGKSVLRLGRSERRGTMK